MVYAYTEQEKMKVLDTFMNDGKVKQVPSSTKKKNILLKEVLKRFDHGVTYTETEVNSILLNVFSSGDYVEQRRYLITFGFFKRSSDGRAYQMMGIEN
ncbi:transcriptional regulator [Enterococcus faecium]|uniref:DUF2087 domain-containing protein n=1 Tax=Enterococcus faecium TaxID=1352 RepID=UPI000C77F9FA|nr:DUF2087 domain-containing protein [Enterococcus faecium]AUJ67869.1 transcriptional regulator [Enterococcus faecium]